MTIPVALGDISFEVRPQESVLDACLRSGIDIPFSCRGGVCHACLLRCRAGDVPPQAQRTLDPALQAKGYLLACQCQPTGPLHLSLPDPADRVTSCMLHDARREDAYLFLRFETARELPCKAGQILQLQLAENASLACEITAAAADSFEIEAIIHCPEEMPLPAWLAEGEFGHDFEVIGPLPPRIPEAGNERSQPESDPQLWHELADGRKVRAILEDFYQQVYADALLAPFFTGSTITRAIEKQYSFLQQLMTGERCYFGDRPRNAHHWMVITDEIYDYRQALMHRTQLAHGLSECQMARWARLENHFRTDMVKDKPWPRRVGNVDIPLEGFAEETLSEGSICDYCGGSVDAGTTVRYHLRLGKISCAACSRPQALADSPA